PASTRANAAAQISSRLRLVPIWAAAVLTEADNWHVTYTGQFRMFSTPLRDKYVDDITGSVDGVWDIFQIRGHKCVETGGTGVLSTAVDPRAVAIGVVAANPVMAVIMAIMWVSIQKVIAALTLQAVPLGEKTPQTLADVVLRFCFLKQRPGKFEFSQYVLGQRKKRGKRGEHQKNEHQKRQQGPNRSIRFENLFLGVGRFCEFSRQDFGGKTTMLTRRGSVARSPDFAWPWRRPIVHVFGHHLPTR
ncbi:hypothetical protein, partial [Phaeobacter sp.]|uniref:hypothetical protein n=1 Tax=Phaeobacter sp. TaxID=1902409 RepID=UPI0025E6A470